MTGAWNGSLHHGAPAYEVRDLGLVYGGPAAVDGVTLRVEAGEAVALVGPSGAGKTSLLRLLAGMLQPTSGTITVHGWPLADLKPGRELTRLVGMMQQQLDLVPQLAVKHNVQAGLLGRWSLWRSLAALALPLEAPRARRLVRRVGLEDRFLTRVSHLSGGEQQRVALARVLLQDPNIVLVDEPVSSLDPALAGDLLQLLREVARENNKTLIASLHAPHLARRYFDRVIGLRAGRVAFDLPPADVTDELLESVYRLREDGTSAPSPIPQSAADG